MALSISFLLYKWRGWSFLLRFDVRTKLNNACEIPESWYPWQASWNVIHYWHLEGWGNNYHFFGCQLDLENWKCSILWENLSWALPMRLCLIFQIFWLGRFLNKTMHIFPKHYFLFIVFTAFVHTSLTVHVDASVVCQKQLLTGQYSFWGWEVLIRLPFFRWWLTGSLPYTSWQSNQVARLYQEGGPGVGTVEFLGIH